MNKPNQASTTAQGETCATHPVGRALRLLGDVWTLLIVYTLLSGTKRFDEAMRKECVRTEDHKLAGNGNLWYSYQ
jgi:DNA-binding HxlR family transcriptional regulator